MTDSISLPAFNESLATAVAEPQRRIVPASEFRELIVSHRRLVRADEPAEGLRGLRDLDSGEWFLTEARKLHESRAK